MSDAWEEIQAVKSKRNELRERLQKRRKEREDLLGGGDSTSTVKTDSNQKFSDEACEINLSSSSKEANKDIENCVLRILTDATLSLPSDSRIICHNVSTQIGYIVSHTIVSNLLQKFAAQELIRLVDGIQENQPVLTITHAEHARLVAMVTEDQLGNSISLKRKQNEVEAEESALPAQTVTVKEDLSKSKREKKDSKNDDVMNLLSLPSTREKENKKMGEEILDLLSKPTVKEKSLAERFRSQGGAQVKEFCAHGTKDECRKVWMSESDDGLESKWNCHRLHFRKIIQSHTDESLGDCSFLNTCFHMETCKYVHYEVDQAIKTKDDFEPGSLLGQAVVSRGESTVLYPAQWIQCDLRSLDMAILGKFSVIMADPPWDIHMELPYGTLSDDEMRQLSIPILQDEGLIFLWVTGRAMELGRECLQLWGYERVDEIIWVKTNQLQRIIRTGRTGHWLNHGKEHCLVGMKGNPRMLNRGLDCDVIVAEVRATSHKPDEMYGIIERLSPGTRKIELFGRPHNVQPNWITLGNQLDGVHLLDPDIARAYQKHYPDASAPNAK
ncbi:N6-adenosine-methyltransferase catalytic subunit-like [Daphnia pulicaria]|uniref:N6-adenosine-methyltransferase catalytic subunit-like n=1 Tax=Daphnia pulicaria TaxID=35523 RepID=UPI001EEB86EB|nr:N6-adenosine-methyltransferase catalytic subunit-like [Daphnia pulicaria]